MINKYEAELTGGHPNSLGNTEAVVADILKDKAKLQDLYDCYQSQDAVVRLRVSSAFKRICKAKPDWVMEYIDRLQSEISQLDQASAKWTQAQLFMWLEDRLSASQRKKAIKIMQHNLTTDDDWIVQNTTAESLTQFARSDSTLRTWLAPKLTSMQASKHKSVARRAAKLLAQINDM